MERLAILVALVTVIGGIPAVGAEHLSVGYEDSVGTSADESPDGGESVDADDYARGTDEKCFEPNGSNTDPGQFQEAAASDPFCGDLIYHGDSGELRQVSPPDQSFQSGTIGTFDVVTTRSYMLAHEARLLRSGGLACQPLCDDNPAGAALWDGIHTVGEEANLTHSPDKADQKERDDRLQVYGADIHTTTARDVLQDSAGTHEMNGWYVPGPTRSFVAYLEDSDGNPIGEKQLSQMVQSAKGADQLPDSAIASVCGWTPDGDFGGTGGATSCEIPFEYEGPGDGETNFKNGYNDKCNSPTYVCSEQSGGAWYANFDCLCSTFVFDDHKKFHWIVAPTRPDCGVREPGFITSHQEVTESKAFLAHDLDVYTNAFGLEAPTATRGVRNVANTALEIATTQDDEIASQLPGVGSLGEVSPPPQVSKEDRVEPNADPVKGLQDTSQSLPGDHQNGDDLQRELSPCNLLSSSESEDTVDPWVDVIDGETNRANANDRVRRGMETDRGISEGAAGAGVQASPGLYQNDDTSQDNDNHPGPSLYSTTGNVGLFTDKNDDGDYDTVAGDTETFSDFKTQKSSIQSTGAYPMIWDVRVKEQSGQFALDTDSGCQISDQVITDGAKKAGYGAETGLFQAIYLQEPTTFVNPDTGDQKTYPDGNNIYLLLSASARTMLQSDTQTEIDAKVDDTLSQLQTYADENNGDFDAPQVVQPGTDLGLESDYESQCPEPTGGFSAKLSFAHSCQVSCEGDTIVTRYVFELEKDVLGGGFLPQFSVGGEPFTFGAGNYDWVDVDPFDNDPGRQDDTDDSPPTGE